MKTLILCIYQTPVNVQGLEELNGTESGSTTLFRIRPSIFLMGESAKAWEGLLKLNDDQPFPSPSRPLR